MNRNTTLWSFQHASGIFLFFFGEKTMQRGEKFQTRKEVYEVKIGSEIYFGEASWEDSIFLFALILFIMSKSIKNAEVPSFAWVMEVKLNVCRKRKRKKMTVDGPDEDMFEWRIVDAVRMSSLW